MWSRVASDKVSGSEELALQVLDSVETLLTHPVDYRAELVGAASLILSAKPRMAILYNLFNHLFLAATDRDSLFEAVRSYRQSLLDARSLLCLKAMEFLKTGHLLLHSYSSTVMAVLERAWQAGIRPRVTVTESRPILEGRITASKLADLGFQVTLIADAAVATHLTAETVILLGADSVTADSVENKIGSYMITLVGCEKGSRVYALATSAKLLVPGVRLPEEPVEDPDEVWSERPAGVEVCNRYFEAIPLHLFCGVILESGLATSVEIAEMLKCRSLAVEMERFVKR